MMLLTKALRQKLPELYSNEDIPTEEQTVVVKFFSPYSNWTWYATEFDGEDIFFGYVDGHEGEWGYFSLSELAGATRMNGKLPLVERDLHWRSTKVKDIPEIKT